jgi:hypothetical protein
MGTAMHENHTHSLRFSRADKSTLDTTRAVVLYGSCIPISRQTDFRDSDPYKEKTTLPRAPADVSELVCVTALGPEGPISVSWFGNINPIPFRGTPQITQFQTKVWDFATDFSAPLRAD